MGLAEPEEHPELPVVYVAAWSPRPGASVLDLLMGSDPFADAEIVEIATGHGPFREQPQRLAELLVAATR